MTAFTKSAFINHLPLTAIVMLLRDNGKKIYGCFSLTKNTVSSHKSKWGLSLLAIQSSASPDPASPFDFCSPMALVFSRRCRETGFPLTSCSLPPTLPPGYRHGSFLLHAACESPMTACPLQGEAIGIRWLEALAALLLLTPANYTMC